MQQAIALFLHLGDRFYSSFLTQTILLRVFKMLLNISNLMRRRWLIAAAMSTALVLSSSLFPFHLQAQTTSSGNAIYFGGDILTMAGDQPEYVEAIAVKDGKITFAGTKAEAMRQRESNAQMIDLQGKTLLPGFIDGHGHAGLSIEWQRYVWLRTPEINSVATLQDALREHAKKMNLGPGDWIVGNGYDPSLLVEKRHPTADELDAVSTENPVFLIHASGHAGVANHKLLEMAGIAANTPDPPDGAIGRVAGTTEPNGLLEEGPHKKILAMLPPLTEQTAPQYVRSGMEQIASVGITTVQEAYTSQNQLELLTNAARNQQLPLDTIVYPAENFVDDLVRVATDRAETPIQELVPGQPISGGVERAMREAGEYTQGYNNRMRMAGVKFFGDGSPVAGTGFLKEPYTARFPGKPADYRGISTLTDEQMDAFVDRWYPSRFQMQIHVNGDAAIEQFINAIEKAEQKHGKQDKRPIAIHSQLASDAQLERMKALGITPSFYSSMVTVAGHLYEQYIGDRALRMNPAASAQRLGIPYTIHNDGPLVPWDILPLVESAVVRRNESNGRIYGPEQRVTPYQALLATTRNAAYSLFEEDSKGSLEAGKLADLVILDQNPLKVDPETIKSIQVLQTIKEGQPVYTFDPAQPRVAAPRHLELALNHDHSLGKHDLY